MTVRTRFARSSTGVLYIGSVRVALFCWPYARYRAGTFVLPIEDTDRERSTDENVQAIPEGLLWLGLDADSIVVKCPAGDAPLNTHRSKNKIEILFDQSRCGRCPNRQRCLGSANMQGRTTHRCQYTPPGVAQYRRRLAEQSEAFTERFRWRAGIEATSRKLKQQMGLAALCVRGKPSVKYAVYLKALGLNIRRVAASYRSASEKMDTITILTQGAIG